MFSQLLFTAVLIAVVTANCVIEAPRQRFHIDGRSGLIKVFFTQPDGRITSFNSTIKVPSVVTSANSPRILFSQRVSMSKSTPEYWNLGADIMTTGSSKKREDPAPEQWVLYFSYTNGVPPTVATSMPLNPGDTVHVSMTYIGNSYVGNNQKKPCWDLHAQSVQNPLNAVEMKLCIDWSPVFADLSLWSLFITDCAVDYPPSPFVWQSVSVAVNGTTQIPSWSPLFSRAGTCLEQVTSDNSEPSTVQISWKNQ